MGKQVHQIIVYYNLMINLKKIKYLLDNISVH